MNRIYFSLCLILFLCTSCEKEGAFTEVEIIKEDPIVLVENEVTGRIVDENGQAIPNVQVSIRGEKTITKNNGHFNFGNLEVKKESGMVLAELSGYYKGIGSNNFTADGTSFVELVMIPMTNGQTINSNTNDIVNFSDEVQLDFRNNTFENANGQPYAGPLQINAEYLDPNSLDFKTKMPGALSSINEEGESIILDPIAMTAVDLRSINGEEVKVSADDSMELLLKVPPGSATNAPTEADVYLYDLEKERWVKSTSCKIESGNYRCTISGSGYIMVCKPSPAICLSGIVYNSDSLPSSFIKVTIEDLTNNFTYFGYTNQVGYFCGAVPRASQLQITIEDHCENILYDATIGPFANDTQIPDIYLPEIVNDYIINISGLANQCNSTSIEKGHITVSYPGKVRIFPIENGTFNFDMGLKCVEFPSLEIQAYDLENEQRSEIFLHEEFTDITTGRLEACETLDDFFKISFEGDDYVMAPTQFYKKENTTSNWWIFQGLGHEIIYQLDLKDYQGVGAYNSNVIFSAEDNSTAAATPFSDTASPQIILNITSDDGEYIEGDFNGMIADNFGDMKPVSSVFKIRKKQ